MHACIHFLFCSTRATETLIRSQELVSPSTPASSPASTASPPPKTGCDASLTQDHAPSPVPQHNHSFPVLKSDVALSSLLSKSTAKSLCCATHSLVACTTTFPTDALFLRPLLSVPTLVSLRTHKPTAETSHCTQPESHVATQRLRRHAISSPFHGSDVHD